MRRHSGGPTLRNPGRQRLVDRTNRKDAKPPLRAAFFLPDRLDRPQCQSSIFRTGAIDSTRAGGVEGGVVEWRLRDENETSGRSLIDYIVECTFSGCDLISCLTMTARYYQAVKPAKEGKGEVKGWKWAGDLRVQICIIAALIFVIWIVLQQQYY